MKLTCDKCSAAFDIDPSRIPASGLQMKCRECGHSFHVPKPASDAPSDQATPTSGDFVHTAPTRQGARPDLAAQTFNMDLPAPKSFNLPSATSSTLGSSSFEMPDLPAPRSTQKSASPNLPGRTGKDVPTSGFEMPDLPAPKGGQRAAAPGPNLPSPKQATSGSSSFSMPDLPAPKGSKSGQPKSGPVSSSQQPQSKATGAKMPADLPTPKGGFSLPDLPTPKSGQGNTPGSSAFAMPDLPAPKGGQGNTPGSSAFAMPDLPAPKGGQGNTFGSSAFAMPDLPAPKGGQGNTPDSSAFAMPDLPAPKAGTVDLPAPKQPFADLPSPKGPSDLPAPKSAVDLPTPKQPVGDLPGPKGPSDLPTPKQPFADLPASKNSATMAFGGRVSTENLDLPELPDDEVASLALEEDPNFLAGGVDLPPSNQTPNSVASTMLGLGAPPPKPSAKPRDEFSSFDLPPPPAAPQAALVFDLPPEQGDLPSGGTHGNAPRPALIASFDDQLDAPPLDSPAAQLSVNLDAQASTTLPDVLPSVPSELLVEPPAVEAPSSKPPTTRSKPAATAIVRPRGKPWKNKRVVVLLCVVGAALMVGGGLGVMSMRGHSGTDLATSMSNFKSSLVTDQYPAYIKAAEALASAGKGIENRALAAQALALAVAIHHGDAKLIKQADGYLADMNSAALDNVEVKKAKAFLLMAENKPADAEAQLTELAAATGGKPDAILLLGLGWSQLLGGRGKSAEVTLQKALSYDSKLASATYGLALCRRRAGDIDGAKTWMKRTAALSPEHFGAALASASERTANDDAVERLLQAQGSTASASEIADAWAAMGERRLQEGRFEEAETAFKKALGFRADSVSALVGIGKLYLASGRPKDAREKIATVRKLDPNNIEASILLAEAELGSGAPFVAQDQLQTAARLVPKDARIKLLQGKTEEAIAKEGAAERAAALYRQAIEFDPGLIDAYRALIAQALRSGHADAAMALAEQAAKHNGETPEVRTLRGEVMLAKGDAPGAQVEFQAALSALPNHLTARLFLAGALEAQKRPDAALSELEKVRKRVPTLPGLPERLASLYQALGRTDDAYKAYETAITSPEAPVSLKFAAASFFLSIGKCDRSREVADRITNEDSHHSDAVELLARAWECTGKTEYAILAVKRAIDITDKPEYHLTYARLLEKADKGSDALAEYETAANRGHLVDAYIGRARLNINFNANREAMHDLELALKIDKNRGDAYVLLGKALLNLQQYKPAESKLLAATKLVAKDPFAHYYLAEACRGSGNYACAGTHYRSATELGLAGEDLGDAYYKLGMFERSRGNTNGARTAFQKCMEIGTDVQKGNCGKESQVLGGYR